jgi:hypothetical protein
MAPGGAIPEFYSPVQVRQMSHNSKRKWATSSFGTLMSVSREQIGLLLVYEGAKQSPDKLSDASWPSTLLSKQSRTQDVRATAEMCVL